MDDYMIVKGEAQQDNGTYKEYLFDKVENKVVLEFKRYDNGHATFPLNEEHTDSIACDCKPHVSLFESEYTVVDHNSFRDIKAVDEALSKLGL